MTEQLTNQDRSRKRTPRRTSLVSSLHRKLDSFVGLLEKAAPELFFKGQVRKLTQRPGDYEKDAAHDTGEEVLDVKFVPQEQVGAVPAVHARWQRTGQVGDLTEAEVAKLKECGFRIIVDDIGPYCFWREKQIQHMWICLSRTSWSYSRAKSVKAVTDWHTAAKTDEPRVPYLEGCERTIRSVLRDSLIEAVTHLEGQLPYKVRHHENFVPAMQMLWEDAVCNLEKPHNGTQYVRSQAAN